MAARLFRSPFARSSRGGGEARLHSEESGAAGIGRAQGGLAVGLSAGGPTPTATGWMKQGRARRSVRAAEGERGVCWAKTARAERRALPGRHPTFHSARRGLTRPTFASVSDSPNPIDEPVAADLAWRHFALSYRRHPVQPRFHALASVPTLPICSEPGVVRSPADRAWG